MAADGADAAGRGGGDGAALLRAAFPGDAGGDLPADGGGEDAGSGAVAGEAGGAEERGGAAGGVYPQRAAGFAGAGRVKKEDLVTIG